MAVAAGGCLGGGSAVNLMCYVRASESDYDGFGMEGWKSQDLIHLLKKVSVSARALVVV